MQSKTAASDACIHAFVRSRPASSLHAMSRPMLRTVRLAFGDLWQHTLGNNPFEPVKAVPLPARCVGCALIARARQVLATTTLFGRVVFERAWCWRSSALRV